MGPAGQKAMLGMAPAAAPYLAKLFPSLARVHGRGKVLFTVTIAALYIFEPPPCTGGGERAQYPKGDVAGPTHEREELVGKDSALTLASCRRQRVATKCLSSAASVFFRPLT